MATSDRFVYVTFIKTTREQLWKALTDPDFTRRYWAGVTFECDWKTGSSWRAKAPDGRLVDAGDIVESRPPERLVINWRHELHAELRAVGFTRATFDLEDTKGVVKLTITHEVPGGGKLLDAFAGGWPHILSSLKSLLETGAALPGTDRWPES